MTNQILTLEQYAQKKGVCLKTIYNWIKVGKIKPIKIGKHKFIQL